MDPEASVQLDNQTILDLSSVDGNLPLWGLIPVAIIYGILIATTIIGNLFVIISYMQDRKIRQRPANLIILNLAFADFIVGLVSLTFKLTTIVSGRWLFGENFCRLYGVIDYLAVYMSVAMILFISIDRYLIVAMPIKYRSLVTHKRVRYAIVPVWIMYTVFCFLLSFGWTSFGGEKGNLDYTQECLMEYLVVSPIVTLSLSIATFSLPFTCVVFLNILIFLKIKRQSKKFQTAKIKRGGKDSTEPSVDIDECPTTDVLEGKDAENSDRPTSSPKITTISQTITLNERTNMKFNCYTKGRIRKNKSIAKKLTVLVVVFGVCWLPYEIFTIMSAFCNGSCISDLAWDFAEHIQWANSAINPILYALTNVHFRRNFIRLIRCSNKII